MEIFGLIITLVLGFLVGGVALVIKGESDNVSGALTVVLGMAGAFVGCLLSSVLALGDGGFGGVVPSVVGAAMTLFLYELATGDHHFRNPFDG